MILASCWALTGSALGAWVFRSWSTQPVPVVNPGTDGPISPYSNLDALIQAFLMAVPLAGLWAGAAVSGFGYLHSARLARRWRAAWACAITSAAAAGVAFIAVFWDPVPLFGQIVLGHPSWGLLAFSAAFLAAGTIMVAIIIAAERQAPPQ